MEELLKKLIKFKTVDSDEKALNCVKYIKDYLKDTHLYMKDYLFNNKRSLVISNTVSNNLDIIFCGHLDVVPAKDEQFNPVICDGKMYGRGTFDMKGHDAVMIELMKNLDTDYKVALFLTSDEEAGGFNGTDILLNKEGYTSKFAIVPDGGNNFNLIEEEKGVLELEISYTGKPAHGSTPYKGINAIVKLMDIYNKIIEIYPIPKDDNDFITSVNLGNISGGDYINRVPAFAKMGLDIRYIPTDTPESILENIKKIDDKMDIKVTENSYEFKYIESDLSKKYLDICKEVLNDEVIFAKCASSSDARFFYKNGISTIMMNACGYDMHGDNEWIDLDSLDKLYEIYSKLINNK